MPALPAHTPLDATVQCSLSAGAEVGTFQYPKLSEAADKHHAALLSLKVVGTGV